MENINSEWIKIRSSVEKEWWVDKNGTGCQQYWAENQENKNGVG